MDYKQIEQILNRYWQCETTLDEEGQLRRFFCGSQVPAHLMPYKDWFVYTQQQHDKVRLGDEFDRRILAEVETPVVKAKRLTLTMRFMPLIKAAAMVAIVLTVGNVMQHTFFADDPGTISVIDTIGNQISTPSVALSGDTEHNDTHDRQLSDSLQRLQEEKVLQSKRQEVTKFE